MHWNKKERKSNIHFFVCRCVLEKTRRDLFSIDDLISFLDIWKFFVLIYCQMTLFISFSVFQWKSSQNQIENYAYFIIKVCFHCFVKHFDKEYNVKIWLVDEFSPKKDLLTCCLSKKWNKIRIVLSFWYKSKIFSINKSKKHNQIFLIIKQQQSDKKNMLTSR